MTGAKEIERVIGREAFARLVEAAGGLSIRVPTASPRGGPLLRLPKQDQEEVVRHFGGRVLYIPKRLSEHRAARNSAIRAAYDNGERVQSLAKKHGLSERWVYEILGRPETEDG